jgi:nitrogen fixation-related uncharacterized protein
MQGTVFRTESNTAIFTKENRVLHAGNLSFVQDAWHPSSALSLSDTHATIHALLHLVVKTLLAVFVVLLVQLLWQVDVGHNDDAEGGRSVLRLLSGVSTRMILVDSTPARFPCF